MREVITSVSNAKIKYFRSLKDKETRKAEGRLLAEGANIVRDLSDDLIVDSIIVSQDKAEQFEDILAKYEGTRTKIYEVSEKCMQQISDTLSPCGIVAVVVIPPAHTVIKDDVAVLDNISDPGNFGTIVRTCVACGISQILAVNCTDWTAGKVVRGSMGGVFNVNIITVNDCKEAGKLLTRHEVFALDMGGENIFKSKFTHEKPFAVVVGNEAHGVSDYFKNNADRVLSLPMKGPMQSLNAAVALSVSVYLLTFLK